MSPNEIIYAIQSGAAKIAELNELLKADRAELAAAKAECERLKFALVEWESKERGWSKAVEKDAAELTRLRAFSDQLSNNLSAVGAAYNDEKARAEKAEASLAAIEEDGTEEHNAAVSLRLKLVTALDRADNAEADNAKWQKLLLMSRDDREIDLISEIEEQARLLGKSGEREADLLGKLGRLESELAAIKNGHGELGKYEQLRLKNAELQAELANIANAKPDTWGDMSDSFQAWAQNRARHALAAIKGTP
jgi:chromosome segregation ATPase